MEGEGFSEGDLNVSATTDETQDLERNIQHEEENEDRQEAAGETNLVGTNLIEAEPHDDDCFIVDVQDASTANNNNRPDEVVWRVRMCPIPFADFCYLKKEFTAIIKLTVFFEFRMSQHLCVRPGPGVQTSLVELQDQDLPMLPRENIYMKPSNAATTGLLEMKVLDSNLLDLMTLIRTINLSKKSRLRFELKRLSVEDTQQKEKQVEGEVEGAAKTEEQTEKEEETEMAEEKTEKGNRDPAALEMPDLLVNFAVRLQPVKAPTFSHPKGYKLQAEDRQICVSKVPADIPDNVLKAVLCSQLLTRQTAEDGTSTMVFQVNSPLGAQGYMELFDGILVNRKELEMSTSLGTLTDAKRKHYEKVLDMKDENKQKEAVKRKHEGAEAGAEASPQPAKKPRDDLDFISRVYLKKKQTQMIPGVPPGSMMQQPSRQGRGAMLQGASRRTGGRLWSRGGLPGRGGPRGALGRGRTGGGRGVPHRGAGRGVRQRSTGRGVLQRGAGRGVLQRGTSRGVLQRGPRRGAPSRGGRGMRSRVRGVTVGRGLGMPRRESASQRMWEEEMGFAEIEDLQAKLMATERQLSLLHQELDRGAVHRGDHFSPGGSYDPRRDFYGQGYDDTFDPDFPRSRKRRR